MALSYCFILPLRLADEWRVRTEVEGEDYEELDGGKELNYETDFNRKIEYDREHAREERSALEKL
jgi:hypothetical protein